MAAKNIRRTNSRPNDYLIVDAHEDIAFNSVMVGQDFLESALTKRSRETSRSFPHGIPTVGFPEMKTANVRVVFGSIWAAPCDSYLGIRFDPCYKTPEEAYAQGQKQLTYYENLTSQNPITIVTRKQDLTEVNKRDYRLGIVLAMEGADPILHPKSVHEWIRRGLRIVGFAHGRTRYSGGTRQPGPLTSLGRELLDEMEGQPVILDTSHMAEASFFEALDRYHGPVIASHSNCRALVPTDRQLSDEMIRAITKRGGIIGIALYNKFLRADWNKSKKRITLDEFIKHVNHVNEIAGDSRHVGIGSDLDGGFGKESIPAELDTVADLPKIATALLNADFSEEETAGLLGENWMRFLSERLPN